MSMNHREDGEFGDGATIMTTAIETVSELKPCPFCGSPGKMIRPMGERVFNKDANGKAIAPFYGLAWFRVVCDGDDCHCSARAFADEIDAANAWNRRSLDTADGVDKQAFDAAWKAVDPFHDQDPWRVDDYTKFLTAYLAASRHTCNAEVGVCATCDGTGKEGPNSICRDCDEGWSPPTLAITEPERGEQKPFMWLTRHDFNEMRMPASSNRHITGWRQDKDKQGNDLVPLFASPPAQEAVTDAEPVAWHMNGEGPEWVERDKITFDKAYADACAASDWWTVTPLYTSPPSPALDVSDGMTNMRETMWAKVIYEGEDNSFRFELNEEGNRDGPHYDRSIEFAADTFPAGTRIVVYEPDEEAALQLGKEG